VQDGATTRQNISTSKDLHCLYPWARCVEEGIDLSLERFQPQTDREVAVQFNTTTPGDRVAWVSWPQRETAMSKNDKTDRRSFLKASAGAGAVAATSFPSPHVMAETAKGANERIGVGFIGVGGRSGAHQRIVQGFQNEGVTQPVAVCDVYRPRLQAASKRLGNAKMYDEHERLLDDPNVDVVCIATPDAHHAPQAIDALNAKKDVYCEKPLTHWNQFELAKQIDAAAKKNDCLVQVGTQYMADDNYPAFSAHICDGATGESG